MHRHPIAEEEMKRAKDAILNSFIFNFDAPEKVLAERMAYEFYGYPADFLERYRAGVEKLTTADVARVAAKYLHKERFPVLVVGNSCRSRPRSAEVVRHLSFSTSVLIPVDDQSACERLAG